MAGDKINVWEGLIRVLSPGASAPWETACVTEDLLSGLSKCLAEGLEEPQLKGICWRTIP